MDKVIKVLLIEDSHGYARLIREMLAEPRGARFSIEHAVRLSEGLERLAKKDIDIILLDLGLPDSQGLDSLSSIKKQAPEIPVVVLTGLDDEELAFTAVRMDAQDYLFKGQIDNNLLVRSIRYAIERSTMEAIIRRQASYDFLTGLPNRMLFLDHLTLALRQAHRSGGILAVMFLDLDRFKSVNDSLGHSAGDNLLKSVAERFLSCVRDTDTVARIGGDEYNILLAHIAGERDAGKIAQKILLRAGEPFRVEGHELHITTSIGISLYPEDGRDAETLLRNADVAMYHVKEHGRNNYQFYNPDMNTRTLERMALENKLRQALEREELVLYYQPLVRIDGRRIVCAEALVRWRHPELGLLDPMRFLPIAEETGFIQSIDSWVLHAACAQNRKWQDTGRPPICVTVNLSARQFQQPDLADTVSRALEDTGLDPGSLDIEITESTAMRNIDLTIPSLNVLTDMGVRFSIDDFGTGCSSLSYLKKLPVQKLKIDRSFISGLAAEPDDREIVKAVIAMAHNLRLQVTAEGVETEEQLSFLHESQCDEVQGFLLGRPLPAEEFEGMIGGYKKSNW